MKVTRVRTMVEFEAAFGQNIFQFAIEKIKAILQSESSSIVPDSMWHRIRYVEVEENALSIDFESDGNGFSLSNGFHGNAAYGPKLMRELREGLHQLLGTNPIMHAVMACPSIAFERFNHRTDEAVMYLGMPKHG